MSALFPELDIEIVEIALTAKAGGSTLTISLSQDFWPLGSIYATNAVSYPLLSGSPTVKRGVDIFFGIDYDVSVDIFADSHLSEYGKSFSDLLESYEIHNAQVRVLYYPKPVGSKPVGEVYAGYTTTHDDDENIRQVLRVVGKQYDGVTGRLSLQCRDVMFKDKEISRKLDSVTLSGLEEQWKGKYGAIVFGESTIAGEGIAIDAPLFGGTEADSAKLFAGWSFSSAFHNKEITRTLVQNQHRDINNAQWVEVDFSTQVEGDTPSASADPPNYANDLSRFARGIVTTPATDAAKILLATRATVGPNNYERCVDLVDGQYLYNTNNLDFLSTEGNDFTFEIWVNPDLLHTTTNRVICRQGDVASLRLEWQLYFNTSDDKFTFGISDTGAAINTTVKWGSAASTGTWYQIICRYNDASHEISITVNDGTAVVTTGAVVIDKLNGPFVIGSNINGEPGFDGLVSRFRYWSRLLTTVENAELYNSGEPLFDDEMSDALAVDLRASYPLNEPFGPRADFRGSSILVEGANDTSVSPVIVYDYCPRTLSYTNAVGKIACNVFQAVIADSGNSYNADDAPIRSSSLDLTTSNFTGATGSNFWNMQPSLVMAPGVPYLVSLEFALATGNSYFAKCAYSFDSGAVHYQRDKRNRDVNWTKQVDNALNLRQYYLSYLIDTYSVTGKQYYYRQLDCDAGLSAFNDYFAEINIQKGLVFKNCVKGLQDLVGTYVTANTLIQKPTDIIKFTLKNSDFGLGLTTEVDTTSLDDARTIIAAQYPNDLKMQIVIESQTYAKDFIREICRQARLVFYKARNGKLRCHAPVPHTSFDAVFTEAANRGNFDLLGVIDKDYSQIINEFHQYYYRDPINQPEETGFRNLNPGEKLANELYITPTESSGSNAYLEGLCSLSQELYGRREHVAALNFYDTSTYGQPVQNYYCARYSSLQKRVAFRVPRRDYFNVLDLFSAVQTQHTSLPHSLGTSQKARVHDSGTPVTVYNEGVPTLTWMGGVVGGQILDIEEQGAWITFTLETISQFT